MIHKNKRFALLLLALTAGAMASSLVAPAFGQGALVTICFRGRTVQVPNYLVQTYLNQPAAPPNNIPAHVGPCDASGF